MALDPPTRTLLAVLRAQPDAEHPLGLVRELDGAGRAALLDLSRQHGLSGWAHRCFRDASIDLPADLAEALRSDHAQNTARSILALAAYRRISRILSEAGVEHIPLKGIRLLETLYPDPGTRQLGDIDVLVRKRVASQKPVAASLIAWATAGRESRAKTQRRGGGGRGEPTSRKKMFVRPAPADRPARAAPRRPSSLQPQHQPHVAQDRHVRQPIEPTPLFRLEVRLHDLPSPDTQDVCQNPRALADRLSFRCFQQRDETTAMVRCLWASAFLPLPAPDNPSPTSSPLPVRRLRAQRQNARSAPPFPPPAKLSRERAGKAPPAPRRAASPQEAVAQATAKRCGAPPRPKAADPAGGQGGTARSPSILSGSTARPFPTRPSASPSHPPAVTNSPLEFSLRDGQLPSTAAAIGMAQIYVITAKSCGPTFDEEPEFEQFAFDARKRPRRFAVGHSMDIGVYWSPPVLEHKLERRHHRGRAEEVWNVRRLPKGLGDNPTGDRLFVASGRRWAGSFRLVPEILYTPTDPACPYALIFDAKSWTPVDSTVPCKPFRGWTYKVPAEVTKPPP